jgi:DNA-binding transcriptional MerR regulator
LDKAPDAFRTISEVADDLKVPQHVLRFWETRFNQIKPMKRAGGRRYYRPDDVDLLRGIHHLLYGEGYTIRGVQRILKDQGLKFVQSVWQPGAEQPVHGPVDDEADQPDESIPEEEPVAAASRPQATPAAIRAQMSREDLRRLQATLFELSECRRLLDNAMQKDNR